MSSSSIRGCCCLQTLVHSEGQGVESYASLVGGQGCEKSQRKIIGQRIYRSKIRLSSAPKVPHSAYACAQLKLSDSYSERNPQEEPKSRQVQFFYLCRKPYTLVIRSCSIQNCSTTICELLRAAKSWLSSPRPAPSHSSKSRDSPCRLLRVNRNLQ